MLQRNQSPLLSFRPKCSNRFSRHCGLLFPDVEVPAKQAAAIITGGSYGHLFHSCRNPCSSPCRAMLVHAVLLEPRRLAPLNPRPRPAVLLSIPRRPVLSRDEFPLSHKRPAAGDGCGRDKCHINRLSPFHCPAVLQRSTRTEGLPRIVTLPPFCPHSRRIVLQ